MRVIIILLIELLVNVFGQINKSVDCNRYFKKFGIEEATLFFKGNVDVIQQSNQVQINLQYFDDSFDDPKYFGLVEEDGKQLETVCLRLKIFQFTNQYHNSSIQIKDLKLESQSNPESKDRYYSFLIQESQLDSRLISYNETTYQGFYSFIFESIDEQQKIYEYVFDFNITLNKTSDKSNNSKQIRFLLTKESSNTETQSQLFWCSNIICSTILDKTPIIRLGDTLTIKQVVTTSNMNNTKLIKTEAWMENKEINKTINILRVNNTIPGQVIIEFKAEIVSSQIKIMIVSYLEGQTHPNNQIINTIDTIIRPLNQLDSSQNETILKWCTNLDCSQYLNAAPQLYLNDLYVLQLIVKSSKSYYLNAPNVFYSGNGLNSQAQPISVNNQNPGQVIIQLKADIIWKQFTIRVDSFLSTEQNSVAPQDDVVSQKTEIIECIKPMVQETCASCEQECENNGFAHESCGECSFSLSTQALTLFLLSIWFHF
ncbi:unnamed protein product [Paramecium sonneborni]|uniref:Transmembrane protein n=1 Tax=Paramecium sonneborni TaxID=65129 RepID=A0A8S1QAU2_9CILI|nr:unnamed protein product [Paramecium sonneborni]